MSLPPQRFWADPELPFLELRSTRDGRTLCYGLHSHAEFSVGLIESGRSVYRNGSQEWNVGRGDIVLMNPGSVHACRALDAGEAWAYTMLYVDPVWLAALQQSEAEATPATFRPLREAVLRRPNLAADFRHLLQTLDASAVDVFEREQACVDFFSALSAAALGHQGSQAPRVQDEVRLRRAIELLQERYAEPLRLADLAQAAGLSANQLTRLFRTHTGLTPHAYLTDLRLQRSRVLLRQGRLPLAEVAVASGFADQAHWQRHWRRQHASTPGVYRRALLSSAPAAPVR